MISFILFEPLERTRFLPLVFAKPFSHLQIGIFSFQKRWEIFLQQKCEVLAPNYLQLSAKHNHSSVFFYINPQFLPTKDLVQAIESLNVGEVLCDTHDTIIAAHYTERLPSTPAIYAHSFIEKYIYTQPLLKIDTLWDLLTYNSACITTDFALLPPNVNAQNSLVHSMVLGEQLYIEQGAQVLCSTLNTTTGPIYIGKNVQVMEGSSLRGPLVLSEGVEIKMGTKIYGGTSIGAYCKMGGEINHSVVQDFSNKAHDGFLGSSLVGSWCNLGAATNNSNLKNNYKPVDIYSYEVGQYVPSSLQFLGLIMGDHTKTGINTMFNTGTVVGIHTNIFGSDFQDRFIPSYTWGDKNQRKNYIFEEAIKTATQMMARRNVTLDEKMTKIFEYLYEFRENPTFGINFAV